MEIRPGTLYDLNMCLTLDTSFETEYVWQMEERNSAGDILVGFHLTRLPRPMRVSGIISPDDVSFNFQNGGSLFVADDDGKVCGFMDVTVTEWNQAACINNMAVAPMYRRKGIGARLLRTSVKWARQKKLRVALLDTSTKAYPAICLYQKHGFVFCGFSDQLYPNRDIAMFYVLNLR